MLNSAEEFRLQLPGGMQLSALAWGPEDGLPMLALHGWLDNAASFAPMAGHLGGVRLVALELAGHGHSDHRAGWGHYHYADYLDEVMAAADALGWQRFDLLGHSMGAGIAPLLAVMAPERINRLLLIDAIGPLGRPPELAAECLQQAARQLAALRGRAERRGYPHFNGLVARRLKGEYRLPEAAARLLSERGSYERDGCYYWRHDPRLQLASPFYLDEVQIQGLLRAIDAPVLLLKARRGLLAGRPQTVERMACVPGLQVTELPGGHHLHMEEPELSAEALMRFIFSGAG